MVCTLDGILLLTLSLVLPIPEILSELLKLSSQNHQEYGLQSSVPSLTFLLRAIKEQQKTFRRQKDTTIPPKRYISQDSQAELGMYTKTQKCITDLKYTFTHKLNK